MKNPWGFHLILDLAQCNPNSIRCYKTIHDFSKRLVIDIDMVPYGPPMIKRFGESDKLGFTLSSAVD